MATSTLLQSPLYITSTIIATIFIGFGINAILNPISALSFFEFQPPASSSSTADKEMVNSLMVIYGARDIFMGLAIYSATHFGNRKTLGWILMAASGVAFVDGAVCYGHGKGEWGHWGYAPLLTVVGGLLVF